jgi:hypothetical protein
MNSVAEYCDRALLIEDSEVKVIGSSRDVSRAYTRMFLDQDIHKHQGDEVGNLKRWGDGRVEREGESEQIFVCERPLERAA